MNNELQTPNRKSKPNLVIVASPRARSGTSSNLLRLVRDYSGDLKTFNIHSTAGTGREIYLTGVFQEGEITLYRAGGDGGIAQLAAKVARGEIDAALLLLDPSDPWTEAVEYRALKRVCIQHQILLMTTYAAAVRWITYEAQGARRVGNRAPSVPFSSQLVEGMRNVSASGEPIHLPMKQRTLALISHDNKKLEMIEFGNDHGSTLAQHQRILTTGTTGALLKLLFSSEEEEQLLIKDKLDTSTEERLISVSLEILASLEIKPRSTALGDLLSRLRREKKIKRNHDFASKISALPSGPLGGDVLIGEAVLDNTCHSIVFFHDPLTAHPHDTDIRLLEHTSQLPGVYAECVSDKTSAEKWINGLKNEMTMTKGHESVAQQMRACCQKYGVVEVVLVDRADDEDCDDLGEDLARACAGYFHKRLLEVVEMKDSLRVGVAWGWGANEVLAALRSMSARGLINRRLVAEAKIVWSPLIGSITAEVTEREAGIIAEGFRDFYGGSVDSFPCAGFALKEAQLPKEVDNIITRLEVADVILTAAASWNPKTALMKGTGLSEKHFPKFEAAEGLISGIFVDKDGREVLGDYAVVGLGYEGFRKAAKRKAVIVMCGGKHRKTALLGIIRAKMISTLITTSKTAEWLVEATSTEHPSDISAVTCGEIPPG